MPRTPPAGNLDYRRTSFPTGDFNSVRECRRNSPENSILQSAWLLDTTPKLMTWKGDRLIGYETCFIPGDEVMGYSTWWTGRGTDWKGYGPGGMQLDPDLIASFHREHP
ncbi:hypothetical protein P4O66_022137 [Electrophorus voltai]|uniref:Uncharacterized protein n=1 Tax=Electrophorus voltai TaxID=2609070 RepID=A0AAD9E306_9TELE|nr:hypothetical protein P4O66_022137 [Electrophorus voltai]